MRRLALVLATAALLAASVLVALLAAAPATAQDDETNILRIGWSQDPKTINPFVGLDEEDYTIWAINWDLLVNLDPADLTPAPGIAESWKVSDDRRTVTFKLVEGAKWSDGEPITSADVKWSLETLGSEGTLFTSYTDGITSIKTPDENTVVIETEEPDARIIGGLFIYIMPEHIWGDVPIEDLTGSYQPEIPMVGSGPYVVTEFERAQIVRMERNPEFRGEPGDFDEIQFIKYGTQDAVERALQLGEIDLINEVEPATFERLSEDDDIEVQRSPAPSYTQLAFNVCPEEICPEAIRNPAVQDVTVRQAVAFGIDRERLQEIATRDTSFVANAILPSFYKSFYTEPEQTYPYDPELANQMLDEAGWTMGDDGIRTKDGERLSFNLYVRSESPFTIQMARLIAEQTKEIGVEFTPQIVSTDKLTELTLRKLDGKPAPEFDTFIWGWGGDPYDPSFLLSILTTDAIADQSSDAFYSNPEYDRLYEEQKEIFDTEERAEVIGEMLALTQRDLPYLVLTEDPTLQAYRTDRIEEIAPICPTETGDLICDAVSYAGILALEPVAGSAGGGSDTITTGLAGLVGILIGFAGGLLVARGRRGDGREPLELPG